MKYIRYTPIGIRELTPDILHMGSFCKPDKRKKCDKEGTCTQQLCYNDERQIAKISAFKRYTDNVRAKIDRAVIKERKEIYKRCRAIEYNVRVKRKCIAFKSKLRKARISQYI